MAKKSKPAKADILEEAYRVVTRLYFGHFKSEETALRGLRRQCPERSADECEEAYRRASELERTAKELVAKNSETLMHRWDTSTVPFSHRTTETIAVDDFVQELKPRCPGFPDSVYREAIQVLFFWSYIK